MKEKREGRLGEVKGKGEGGLGEMPPQRIAFDFQRSGFPVSIVLDEILNRFQRIKSPEGGEMLRNRVGGGRTSSFKGENLDRCLLCHIKIAQKSSKISIRLHTKVFEVPNL